MFADPAVLTVNTVAKSLVRIKWDEYSSEYLLKNALDEYKLNTRNTSYTDKTRGILVDRHNVEFVHTVYPVAPSTVSTIRKAYVVFENQTGDTVVDPVKTAAALLVFLSEANLTKLANKES